MVTGVPAVKDSVLVVNLTPLLLPMVDIVRPAGLAVALVKFGTSVPAVAVQESPISGSFEQKSIRMSGFVTEVAGVNVTVYVTPVALAAELLIVMLRVVTWPALTDPGKTPLTNTAMKDATKITPKERPNDDCKICTLLTCFLFLSFLNCSFLK